MAVQLTPLDRILAPLMFWLAFAFLCLLAGLLCAHALLVDSLAHEVLTQVTAPAAVELATELVNIDPLPVPDPTPSALAIDENIRQHVGPMSYFLLTMAALYPLFWLEALAHGGFRGPFWKRHLLCSLCPPARLGGRDHVDGQSIWLPAGGWVRIDRDLRTRVEAAFSGPMILIALAVLPLLGFEYYVRSQSVEHSWSAIVFLTICESLIWLAFSFEFIVMLAIVPRRWRYCREHWIDIAIICLPLVGFLRILRLGRMLRLHQVLRVGRAYRLRGLSSRMLRGVLLVSIIRRFVEGAPERRLCKLRDELAEREYEVQQLRAEIQRLEQLLAERQQPPDPAG